MAGFGDGDRSMREEREDRDAYRRGGPGDCKSHCGVDMYQTGMMRVC